MDIIRLNLDLEELSLTVARLNITTGGIAGI